MEKAFLHYFFFLGLAVGSFLNVCIFRMPRGRSVVHPPSACPKCKTRIQWYDNIPVMSWILLRGRCRSCGVRISPRYPLIELGTGLIFLFLATRLPWDWTIAFPLYYASVLIAVTFTDFDMKLIPDLLTLPAIPLGVIYHGWIGGAWIDSLVGLVVGGGSLWLIGEIYLRLRKVEGMGGGDVKLAAMMGAFLGWKSILAVLFLSSLAGGIFGIALMVFARKGGKSEIPFGVFLAPVGFLLFVWGEEWIGWYLKYCGG